MALSSSYEEQEMEETDRIPNGWDQRLNKMDEIWVPTHHHKQIFENGGVTKPVVVVGQGIDVDYWDPNVQEPLPFNKIDKHNRCADEDYKFLSVFKCDGSRERDRIYYCLPFSMRSQRGRSLFAYYY
mmetsp:Transcript_36395/g.88152  ORF Transcript_36395/g.88152 Transcript_36395/m.88152 type:complete len:127 (+) Transcript_36395:647-1027(+)